MRSPYFPRTSPRSHQKSLRRVIAVAFVVVLALAAIPGLFIALLLPAWRTAEHPIENPGRVLLVTAHPDDETVFFGPTISGLHEQGHEVFLLCFTTGASRAKGNTCNVRSFHSSTVSARPALSLPCFVKRLVSTCRWSVPHRSLFPS